MSGGYIRPNKFQFSNLVMKCHDEQMISNNGLFRKYDFLVDLWMN